MLPVFLLSITELSDNLFVSGVSAEIYCKLSMLVKRDFSSISIGFSITYFFSKFIIIWLRGLPLRAQTET